MSAFTGAVQLEQTASWREWKLLDPTFGFEVGAKGSGRWIRPPLGSITDGASIPRVLWAILPPFGPWVRAAIIHDELCRLLQRGTPHPEAPDWRTAAKVWAEMLDVLELGSGARGWALKSGVSAWAVYEDAKAAQGGFYRG